MKVFPSDFNNIDLKYFSILQNLMRNYKILWKLMKAAIFHNIFSVKSLTFIPFHLIAKYFLHFVILYCDEQNFSVCYCTISPLDNIGKYFTIVKRKVIFPISQILTSLFIIYNSLLWTVSNALPSLPSCLIVVTFLTTTARQKARASFLFFSNSFQQKFGL